MNNKVQAINYFEAYNIADGLLINFDDMHLEYHCSFNKQLKIKHPDHQ